MEGYAIAAGKLVWPTGCSATWMHSKPSPTTRRRAKKLLAEAGYPDGFAITIHAPNNRYVNDD